MFKKLRERMAAAAVEQGLQAASLMEPGEVLIGQVMASSAATKNSGGPSGAGRLVRAVGNVVREGRYVDGPAGSVARRFPDDNPYTQLIVSSHGLRLLQLSMAGIGKPMTLGDELLRVGRAEISSFEAIDDDKVGLSFADGSYLALQYAAVSGDLPAWLGQMGIPAAPRIS